eukprot:GILJ01012283.1.p1 GENE.GILJ01012283.1~~GILJ01012283.1.p1  ORF type:complete len:520 (+),score=46.63 GILJ01012283.1:36-1562(+)
MAFSCRFGLSLLRRTLQKGSLLQSARGPFRALHISSLHESSVTWRRCQVARCIHTRSTSSAPMDEDDQVLDEMIEEETEAYEDMAEDGSHGEDHDMLLQMEPDHTLMDMLSLDVKRRVLQNEPGSLLVVDETRAESFSGMQVIFLGTSAGKPTIYRNCTSHIVRLDAGSLLFDAGEGTQHTITRYANLVGSMERIFITHLHGDHVFGLPGMICHLAPQCKNRAETEGMLHIYGPVGLRSLVRSTLHLTHTRINNYVVHELRPSNCKDPPHPQDILATEVDGVDVWNVADLGDVEVKATNIRHTVSCFGYAIEEKVRLGRFLVQKAISLGLKPGPAYSHLKRGVSVVTKEGIMVHPSQVIGPSLKGRKIVILGDTCDASNIMRIGMDADLLIHESTLLESMGRVAQKRGHSTAGMAGKTAKSIQAKALALTHFSPRLCKSRSAVGNMVEKAKSTFGNDRVFAAEDLLVVSLPRIPRASEVESTRYTEAELERLGLTSPDVRAEGNWGEI